MTVISLKDANGKEFALGAPQNDSGDPLTVSLRVSQALPAGRYTVTWRTAASDGHPTHGTFSFVILTTAVPAATGTIQPVGASTDTNAPTTSTAASSTTAENGEEADAASSLSNSLARTFSFVGLLVLIGATSFRILVLPRAREIKSEVRSRMDRRAAVLGLVASVLVIVSALVRIGLESEIMNAMPGMQTMSMTDMTMHTRWGFALRLELGAAFVALVSFALAARGLRLAWAVASISAVVLAVTPALAGHAAASPRFTSVLIASDFLHVLGASSWLGSLFAVMVVGVPLAFALGAVERWPSVASLVNSFSPIALGSATVVGISGVIASWVHLDHLSALWQTSYGQVLLVKLFLVAITLTIGAYNFRRVQPQLVNELGSSRLRRSATIELGVGFLVLVATGFLTGISP
jgi:putative copper export protein